MKTAQREKKIKLHLNVYSISLNVPRWPKNSAITSFIRITIEQAKAPECYHDHNLAAGSRFMVYSVYQSA